MFLAFMVVSDNSNPIIMISSPFFILHLQNPLLDKEIQFYLDNFSNFGFKLHTFVSNFPLSKVKRFFRGIDVPLLIHSGADSHSAPSEIIKFAKGYKGNILMAHAARLSSKHLKEISRVPNLFVDVSPLTSFYKRILEKDYSTILESSKNFDEMLLPQDIYKYILKFCDPKKVLFGTDAPWCNHFGLGYEREVESLRSLDVSKEVKDCISHKNFITFLKRK